MGFPSFNRATHLKLHSDPSQSQLQSHGPDTNQRERAELQRPGEGFPHNSNKYS